MSAGRREGVRHLKAGSSTLLMLLLFWWAASAAQEEAFTESVIIFNTVCARCHEAQCSGRLSFDEALKVSRKHIVRHYGPASGKEWLQEELFDILNYMKEKCAYYPMRFPIPPRRLWSSAMLEKMRTLTEKDYFVPLGALAPGRYELMLELVEDAKIEIHLVSESFEMAVDGRYQSTEGRISIPFSIAETENYYFRLHARQPLPIRQLAVTPSQ